MDKVFETGDLVKFRQKDYEAYDRDRNELLMGSRQFKPNFRLQKATCEHISFLQKQNGVR